VRFITLPCSLTSLSVSLSASLRYANRAKSIKNKPKINEDPKDAMIREFKEEIERLRKLISEQGITVPNGISVPAITAQPTNQPAVKPSKPSPRIAAVESPVEDSPRGHLRDDSQSSSDSALITTPPPIKPSPPSDDLTTSSVIQTSDIVTSMESVSPVPSHEQHSTIITDQPSKTSPRSNKSSPRAKNLRSPRPTVEEKVRVEKEYIEKIVEVEKISQDQIQKQKV
jgi:hypothetical protein